MRRMPRITILGALTGVLLLVAPPARAQKDRWQQLNSQAARLQEQGKYAEALPVAEESAKVAEGTFGLENEFTLASLNRLATIYSDMGDYPDAEKLYKRALPIAEKVLGPTHLGVSTMLNNLGSLYKDQGRYADAEQLYKRSLDIDEKTLGANDAKIASDLNNLGLLDAEQGRYADAEQLYKRAQGIDEKTLGTNSSNYATDLHNQALLYDTEGRYKEAEALFTRAITIDLRALGPYHPGTAYELVGLASLYQSQARYGEAEPLFKAAVNIFEKALGPEHPTVATALNNLALLYEAQGRFAEAEPLLKRALAINAKVLGPNHVSVAADLTGLAAVYRDQGRYKDAEALLKRALEIDEKALGAEHLTVAATLELLGGLYELQSRFADAEPLYSRALGINVKALGADNPRVAASLNNFAAVLKAEGLYAQAEPIYKRAIAIDEKALGPDHPDLAISLSNLASLYFVQGHYADAAPLFDRTLEIIHERFQYAFAYMSEKDRLQFLATVQGIFPAYFSFALADREHDPSVAGRMYDVILWEKGLVGTSVAALRAQVAASGDPKAVELLDNLTTKKSEASQLAAARPPGWVEAQARVNAEANALEQQLARRVSSLGEKDVLARATWQDVQKALRPEDAAVEYVRFRFHDGKQFTGNFIYVALVVTPKSKLPAFVVLGEARKLEATPISDYRLAVGKTRGVAAKAPAPGQPGAATNANSSAAYDAYWKPLEPSLGGAKRVYVSPDGVLNQIPVGLFADANGQLLLEKYDLRIVNSTKDLLRTQHAASAKTAVLLGNPKFDLSETDQRAALEKLKSGGAQRETQLATATTPPTAAASQRSRDAKGGPLPPLPATQVEIDAVAKLLKDAGWQPDSYTGDRALEEVLERQKGPRLVHVATHGFFLTDQDAARQNSNPNDPATVHEDPMLRSGLFFAGADRAESGAAPAAGMDDGVLTAYEATQLNLQGTELVVLSACETGLGEQQNGEGVFGLRRGLQEAGAESILMSMWSVPDRETQELMTLFYANWLSGQDKHEALRQAQLKEREVVRQRYADKDLPFYWGAFVLVGR
jgi:CHAT domain-containing protein/tetratricopeptide (TPR) repeat protein